MIEKGVVLMEHGGEEKLSRESFSSPQCSINTTLFSIMAFP